MGIFNMGIFSKKPEYNLNKIVNFEEANQIAKKLEMNGISTSIEMVGTGKYMVKEYIPYKAQNIVGRSFRESLSENGNLKGIDSKGASVIAEKGKVQVSKTYRPCDYGR